MDISQWCRIVQPASQPPNCSRLAQSGFPFDHFQPLTDCTVHKKFIEFKKRYPFTKIFLYFIYFFKCRGLEQIQPKGQIVYIFKLQLKASHL